MASGSNPRRTRQRDRVPDDHRVDPPTPQGGIPSKTRLANIPQRAIDKATKVLKKQIHPDEDEDEIRESLRVVWTTVQEALEHDPKLKDHLANKDEFFDNVEKKGEQNFIESLRAMASSKKKDAWEDLFEDEVFLKGMLVPNVDSLDEDTDADAHSQEATQRAWQLEFKGDAATVLLQTISSFLDKQRNPYSRQATIVNSSGTGKSRMVDQLARKIITIPMCLRPEESDGYPPRDGHLLSWLLSGDLRDQITVQKRLFGFVYALLTVTRTKLKTIDDSTEEKDKLTETDVEIRQAKLASAFRDLMTKGQSYKRPNDYRVDFYKEVIRVASDFMEGIQQVRTNVPIEFAPYVSKDLKGVDDARKLLTEFVDPQNLLDRGVGQPRRPLVIFSFDEAHTLTDNPPQKTRSTSHWTLFSELRRILRETSNHAIFFLFLSTAGRFHLFSPEIRSDPSRRIQNSSLSTLDPITEVSFDDLAYDAPEKDIMLARVVEMDWICHLGRPLFASIYDYVSDQELMDLAKVKLLDGPSSLNEENRSGSLACLSVRFALEFNQGGTAGDIARTQVERHMRLCLAATAGRETFITSAGSEPLLAEAAYELMKMTQSNPVRHLANHSDLHCVDRGRRGELVAALLIMRACDAARAASSGGRWVSVNGFMEALLPPSGYRVLKESFPNSYRTTEKRKFTTTFKDYGIWFNHVIKVEKDKMFSADHLWKFIMRGAMILCTDTQKAIDIVIPICHTQQPLSRDSVTAILVQVKNADEYQHVFKKTLFDPIDPIKLGLFPSKVDPKPVIRIVLALASRVAGVDFPDARQREHHYDDLFTAFDVWCAGLSNESFKHVDDDEAWYRILLERSLRPHDAFELQDDPKVDKETKHSRGTLRRRMAPLTTDDAAHHAIHLRDSNSTA